MGPGTMYRLHPPSPQAWASPVVYAGCSAHYYLTRRHSLLEMAEDVASGELLFVRVDRRSKGVPGLALRSSRGAVSSKCTGDLSLYLSSGDSFFVEV